MLSSKCLKTTAAFLLSVAICGVNALASAAAPSANQTITLQTGQRVKFISMGPAPFDAQRQALVFKYQTNKKVSEKEALAKEADDIWDLLRIDAEQGGYNLAIISANFPTSANELAGGLTQASPCFNFVMQRGADKNWTCANEPSVGMGNPAKKAYGEAYQFTKAGKIDQAIAAYTKAISLDPNYAQAYADRAAINLLINKVPEAMADSNKAISLMPDHPGVYCNRGLAYLRLDQCQKAIDDLSKAIKLNPDFAANYANRGLAYARVNQTEKAIVDFSTAISLGMQSGEVFYNRALAFNKLGQQDLQKAGSLGYNPPKAPTAIAQRPAKK